MTTARAGCPAVTSGQPNMAGSPSQASHVRVSPAARPDRSRGQAPQHVVQDAAVAEIFELVERIDAADQRHAPWSCRRRRRSRPCSVWRGCRPAASPRMVTVSSPLRPSVFHEVPSSKTSGSTPMPTRLERWMRSKLSRDDGAHAEQPRALRRPVARRAGAVFLAGEDDQRHALGAVAHRRVVDRQDARRRAGGR